MTCKRNNNKIIIITTIRRKKEPQINKFKKTTINENTKKQWTINNRKEYWMLFYIIQCLRAGKQSTVTSCEQVALLISWLQNFCMHVQAYASVVTISSLVGTLSHEPILIPFCTEDHASMENGMLWERNGMEWVEWQINVSY